jgi:hypothetical protein
MDVADLGTYSNVGTLVVLCALVVYKFIKHSKCRSRCFGQENSIKIDLSAEKLMSYSPPTPPSPVPDKGDLFPAPRPTIFV